MGIRLVGDGWSFLLHLANRAILLVAAGFQACSLSSRILFDDIFGYCTFGVSWCWHAGLKTRCQSPARFTRNRDCSSVAPGNFEPKQQCPTMRKKCHTKCPAKALYPSEHEHGTNMNTSSGMMCLDNYWSQVFIDSKFMKCMFWNSLRVHASTSSNSFWLETSDEPFKWISPFFCLQRFLQFLKDRFSPTFLGCSKAADGMRHCQASSCLKESIRIHQRSPWQG